MVFSGRCGKCLCSLCRVMNLFRWLLLSLVWIRLKLF